MGAKRKKRQALLVRVRTRTFEGMVSVSCEKFEKGGTIFVDEAERTFRELKRRGLLGPTFYVGSNRYEGSVLLEKWYTNSEDFTLYAVGGVEDGAMDKLTAKLCGRYLRVIFGHIPNLIYVTPAHIVEGRKKKA